MIELAFISAAQGQVSQPTKYSMTAETNGEVQDIYQVTSRTTEMAKIITKEMEKCAYNKKSPLLTSAVSKLLNK